MLNYCEVQCENNLDCCVGESSKGTGTALTQRYLADMNICKTEVTSSVCGGIKSYALT